MMREDVYTNYREIREGVDLEVEEASGGLPEVVKVTVNRPTYSSFTGKQSGTTQMVVTLKSLRERRLFSVNSIQKHAEVIKEIEEELLDLDTMIADVEGVVGLDTMIADVERVLEGKRN